MKTKTLNLRAVRGTALIFTTMLLPVLLPAQQAKTLTVRTDVPVEVPQPPALKEETFLGISTHSVDAALAAQMELPPETGLVVVQIMPDSPAAGVLKQLDLLTRFDDQILIEPRQLGVLVRSKKEGDEVKLTLFRAGKKQTVSVKLGKKAMPPLPARHEVRARKAMSFETAEPFMGPGIARPGPSGSFGGVSHSKEMRISRFEGKNSQMVFDDGQGRLEVNFKDGKKRLTARNAKGDILFDGPVETAEDRKALPAEVRARLEKMEATDVRIPAPPPPPAPGAPADVFIGEPGAFIPAPVERGEMEAFEFEAESELV
ncbi:MAG: PDZ domain-containing protein [Nibricoccus sp.]